MLIIPEQITRGKSVFKYNSYWNSWSRIISFGPEPGWYLELELAATPSYPQAWEKIAHLNFRYHNEIPCIGDYCPEKEIFSGDRFTRDLPSYVLENMQRHLDDADVIQYMLTEDFYPQIDLNLLKDSADEGCPLIKCLKV